MKNVTIDPELFQGLDYLYSEEEKLALIRIELSNDNEKKVVDNDTEKLRRIRAYYKEKTNLRSEQIEKEMIYWNDLMINRIKTKKINDKYKDIQLKTGIEYNFVFEELRSISLIPELNEFEECVFLNEGILTNYLTTNNLKSIDFKVEDYFKLKTLLKDNEDKNLLN